MTREEAIEEINKVFEPAFANYIITALTEGVTASDKALKQEPCEDVVSRKAVIEITALETQARVKALPPVTPKQRWIPVSERLPEDGRPVLIYAWNVHHVIARYDEFRTANGYKKTWVTADAWNGNTEIKYEVIVWMPLSEP